MQDVLIQDIMTTKLYTVNCEDIVSEVARIFKEQSFHHVLVVNDEGGLEGIISHTDMDRTKSGATLFKNPKKEEYDAAILRSKRACEIMSKNLVVLEANNTIRHAYKLFKKNTFRALPVVKENKLVGIITPLDILDHFFK